MKTKTNNNMPRTESDLNNPKTGRRGLIPPLGVEYWKLEDERLRGKELCSGVEE